MNKPNRKSPEEWPAVRPSMTGEHRTCVARIGHAPAIPGADKHHPGALVKSRLAALLVDHIGLSKDAAREVVDFFFDEIRHALAPGETVRLRGWGNFNRANQARQCPATG